MVSGRKINVIQSLHEKLEIIEKFNNLYITAMHINQTKQKVKDYDTFILKSQMFIDRIKMYE